VGIYTFHNQEDSARTLKESTVVERVARIVASVRGLKPDYTRLAAELEQAIPFDVFGIVLWQHDRKAVRVMACYRALVFGHDAITVDSSLYAEEEQRGVARWEMVYHQHPFQDSMLEQLLQAPRLVTKEYPQGINGSPAECGDALSGYPHLRSTLIIPLKVEERILGTLELGSHTTGIYANEDLQRLIKAVAHVVAAAIEGAQSGGSAEIQNRQREALKYVSHAMTEKVDLATILQRIVNGISHSLDVASAIVTHDTKTGQYHLQAQAGLEPELVNELLEQCFPVRDRCILGYSVLYRRPCGSQNVAEDPYFPDSVAWFEKLGIRTIYCHPLLSGSNLYGVMILCSHQVGGFTPLKLDILSLFASQATIAFRNSLLLETLEQRSRFQERVEQLEKALAGEEMLSDADTMALLNQVRKEAKRTFGVNFSTLMRFISERLLTQDERDLLALSLADAPAVPPAMLGYTHSGERDRVSAKVSIDQGLIERVVNPLSAPSLEGTLSQLTRSTETTLARAGMLGELSELLMRLKQSTAGVKDAWFMINSQGLCVYMNPAAEQFCGISMTAFESYASLSIEQVFVNVLPRMRNATEVRHYLQEIIEGNTYLPSLRCTLAGHLMTSFATPHDMLPVREVLSLQQLESWQAPGDGASLRWSRAHSSSSSSDYYYHFTPYPVYNQKQLICYALQVSDITEQVRDEKNRAALLSSVSHDLRTPLTLIKAGVSGLLQEGTMWDEQDRRSILLDIEAGADSLVEMITALIDLSRMEIGALVLEKEWCDSVEVASRAIDQARRVTAGRPVLLYAQSSLPQVFLDYIQIERVFVYLLANAARTSSKHAKIMLTIDLVSPAMVEGMTHGYGYTRHKGQMQFLRVRVIDWGVRVPEHERLAIFQSREGTQSYGNGLGLSICKGIVEAHHGRIWVESVPTSIEVDGEEVAITGEGAGSCFVFIVPTHLYETTERGDGKTILSQSMRQPQKTERND
jgi:signal transduction histidine kinase/GAF domain-containing protein